MVAVTLCLPAEPPSAALQHINVCLPGGVFVYPLMAGFSLPWRTPEQLKLLYLKGENDFHSSLKNFQAGGTYFPVKGRKFQSTCNSEL